MIRDPQLFHGRRAELDHIFGRLNTMQSVSLVGERRIGKSSLLYHVFQTGTAQLGAGVQIVYTGLPDVKDEPSFYRRVCLETGARGTGESFGDLERTVRDRKVVLCLDEFEKVAGQPAFSRGFFDSLRSLAQSGSFALVVATQHSLAELCRTEQIATSPFWNIFARVDLGLFTDSEARELVRARFREADTVVTEEEVARLLQLAGPFPLLLQAACYHLFGAKAGREPDWEAAVDRDPDIHDHVVYLWEHLSREAQAALRWVLGFGGRLPDDRLLWHLERRGLLMRDDRTPYGYWVFSDAFSGIVSNPPRAPRRGSLPSWLKRFVPWVRGGKIGVGAAGPSVEIELQRPEDKH
jgi:hypothetical protein